MLCSRHYDFCSSFASFLHIASLTVLLNTSVSNPTTNVACSWCKPTIFFELVQAVTDDWKIIWTIVTQIEIVMEVRCFFFQFERNRISTLGALMISAKKIAVWNHNESMRIGADAMVYSSHELQNRGERTDLKQSAIESQRRKKVQNKLIRRISFPALPVRCFGGVFFTNFWRFITDVYIVYRLCSA